MGAGGQEDVLHAALEVVVGEQRLELVVGVRVDGLDEEVGLVGEASVDGAGGDAGPAGDLGDAGLVVAPLREDLGRGGQQAVAQGVDLGVSGGQGRLGHPSDDNDYYPGGQRVVRHPPPARGAT